MSYKTHKVNSLYYCLLQPTINPSKLSYKIEMFSAQRFLGELPSAHQRTKLHISCNIDTHDLTDTYAVSPWSSFGHVCDGKKCIVHTSHFAHLEFHKNYMVWYTDLKLSGMKKE